jgi:hypothetical protein
MMRTWWAASLAMWGTVAVGCAPKAVAPSDAPETGSIESQQPNPSDDALECGPPVRGAEKIVRAGAVVLVGEMHGTEQVPATVGRLACNAAQQGTTTVVLGLEIGAENQPAVDAFLASDGGELAAAELLKASHFAFELKDGRNSQAMHGLLDAIRRWRSQGASIEAVCFDAAPGVATSASERDAAMARTLLDARQQHPAAVVLTLTGNIHNRTVRGAPWDKNYVPMGAHMREAFPETISLDFHSAGGTAWFCTGMSDDLECGAGELDGEDRGTEPFIELLEERNELGFDGLLYVGSTTASPPAGQPG